MWQGIVDIMKKVPSATFGKGEFLQHTSSECVTHTFLRNVVAIMKVHLRYGRLYYKSPSNSVKKGVMLAENDQN